MFGKTVYGSTFKDVHFVRVIVDPLVNVPISCVADLKHARTELPLRAIAGR